MNIKNRLKPLLFWLPFILVFFLSACSQNTTSAYDGKDYIDMAVLTEAGNNPEEAAAAYEPVKNYDSVLSVPTYVTKVDDTYFIVDCYHNRIIYSKEWGIPLDQWYILTGDVTQPHTLASDGTVYITDDTENNRILVFEKSGEKFINTQVFYNVGNRPHYTVYDKASDTFYVWSSVTGELYCFRHTKDSGRIYLTEIKKIDVLDGIYVRSFSIIDGEIYFVSGVSSQGVAAKIYRCSLDDLSIIESYDVPNDLAGMVQITKISDYYYITISTDLSGNQDAATIVRTKSLKSLASSDYEDIYSTYFIGGGTPYYISEVDGTYYLTEHRLKGHSIWTFTVDAKGNIMDVIAAY